MPRLESYEVWAITRGKRALNERVKNLVADRHDPSAMEKVVAREDVVWDLVVDCICYDLPDMLQDIEQRWMEEAVLRRGVDQRRYGQYGVDYPQAVSYLRSYFRAGVSAIARS